MNIELHHVSLLVADTARAVDFYTGVLGLEIDPDRPELDFPGAWLRVGERQIHLLELSSPDPVNGRPAHGGGIATWPSWWTIWTAISSASKNGGWPLPSAEVAGAPCSAVILTAMPVN